MRTKWCICVTGLVLAVLVGCDRERPEDDPATTQPTEVALDIPDPPTPTTRPATLEEVLAAVPAPSVPRLPRTLPALPGVSAQPARGTDPLAPRLVSAAHLAEDDAVRVHQCMRCAAEVPATPERVTDLPADERADPALARLDCPQCGAKRSALLTVTCPKCRNRFVPPTVRTLIDLAEGREDETEYAWPRDVCPHCGTDVIEHLRKPKTTTTSRPLDASSRE